MTLNKTDSRALEVTIISAESLSLPGNRTIKKNAYVVIQFKTNTTTSTTQLTTTMDPENGTDPSWNHKFYVHMPMHETFFTLQVRCNNSLGDHVIGSAKVPVSDFTGAYFPNNYLHFLSYRLRDRYGGRNGIVNLSVKTKKPSPAAAVTGWKADGVVVGVPVGNQSISS